MKKWLKTTLCGLTLGLACLGFSGCTTQDLDNIQFRYNEDTGYVQYLVDSEGNWKNIIQKDELLGYLGDDIKGNDGKNGENGSTWYSGTSYPTNAKVGDYFLNTTNGNIYKKTSNNWSYQICIKGTDGTNGTNGTNGANGQDGATWYSGTSYPTDAKIGDYFLNTTTNDVYKKTALYHWTLITNIKGEDYVNKTYTVTFDYADEGFEAAVGQTIDEYFQFNKTEELNYSSWLGDKMPTFKDTILEEFFEGWKVKDADTFMTPYDVIGGDVTLEAKWKYSLSQLFTTNLPKQSFDYSRADDGYSIVRNINFNANEVVIPTLYYTAKDGLAFVNDICYDAFDNYTNITTVSLPLRINVQREGFSGCSAIERVNVLNIDEAAKRSLGGFDSYYDLYENEKLVTNIRVKNTLAIDNCKSIESIVYDEGITEVFDRSVSGCINLKSVSLPNSIKEISRITFVNCPKLQYTIKDKLQYLGNDNNKFLVLMGTNDYKLKKCDVADGAVVIAKRALYEPFTDSNVNTIGLTEIKLAGTVKYINAGAFYDSDITNIIIPASVEKIGLGAFAENKYLQNIQFESSPQITFGAFAVANSEIYGDMQITIADERFYNYFDSVYMGGIELSEVKIFKVSKNIVNYIKNTNTILNDISSYTKTEDGDYYIYTKIES